MPGPGLFLSQKQLQVLKPQQILVASLLQLPMLLLEQKIQMELHLNPVLEETEEWEDTQEDEEEIDEKEAEKEQIQDEFATLEENNCNF
jgi:RNA polymerase sigma-54 factor